MEPLRLGPTAIITADAGVFAAVEHANLALTRPRFTGVAPGVTRLVCWSGWFGGDARPPAGAFPRDFRTWTPAAWAVLQDSYSGWRTALEPRGVALCLRPHARHILSDVQRCLAFFGQFPQVRLILDPASLLTGSMLADAQDHLTRTFETLGPHPAAEAVVLANVQTIDTDDADALGPAPLHRGLIDPALLVWLWRRHCPPEMPCALMAAEFDAQLALLAAS